MKGRWSLDDETTFNFAMVGVRGDTIVILRPGAVREMSKDQALLLAAYLVALADDDGRDRFMKVLDRVLST